ncbi:MAG: hypothetical protein ABIQ32_08250 [Sphingomicrobium sp.]
MPEVIEKAREKLALLEAEADKLRTFLRVYADLAGVDTGDNVPNSTDFRDSGGRTASPTEIVEGAKDLMREHKRPLSRSQIVKLLAEKGLRLPGKDRSKNVGTVIWRSKQFANIEGQGYWPLEFGGWLGQRPVHSDGAVLPNML